MKNSIAILSVITAFAAGALAVYIYQNRLSPAPVQKLPDAASVNDRPLGADRDEHGCIGSAGYQWCQVKQKCLRTWEEPCETVEVTPSADESGILISTIKQALVSKHGESASKLNITVSKISGDYASGGASGEGGGGIWFSAKTGGTWKLVWDGNGVITCIDIAPYPDFPITMIPECFDSTKQQMVMR